MLRSRLLSVRGNVGGLCALTRSLLGPSRAPRSDLDEFDDDVFADMKDDDDDEDDNTYRRQPPRPAPKASLLSKEPRKSIFSSPSKRAAASALGGGVESSSPTYPKPSLLGSVTFDDTPLDSSNSRRKNNNKMGRYQKAGGLPYEETTFDDEWKCPSCTKSNFLNRSSCRSCGTLKPRGGGGGSSSNTPSSNGSSHHHQLPRILDDSDELMPPMMDDNDISGGRPPSPKIDPVARKGDWKCPSCSTLNFARRVTCFACTIPKPLLPAGMLDSGGIVDPEGIRDSSEVRKSRSLLGRAPDLPPTESTRGSAATKTADDVFAEDSFYEAQLAAHWVCDDCGMVNGTSRTVCVGCSKHYNKVGDDGGSQSAKGGRSSSPMPTSSSPPSRRQLLESILAEEERNDDARNTGNNMRSGSAVDVFGDSLWDDADNNHNNNDEAHPSHRGDSDGDAHTAPNERPKKLPFEGEVPDANQTKIVDLDWACPSCQYINFRARSTCRQCHETKPEAVIELQKQVAEKAGLKLHDKSLSSTPTPQKRREIVEEEEPVVDRSLFVPSEAPSNCQRYFRDRNPRVPLSLFSYNKSTKTDPTELEGITSVIAGRSISAHLLGCIPLHKRFGHPSTGHFDILLNTPYPRPHRLTLGDWQCGCGVVNRASRYKCMGCQNELLIKPQKDTATPMGSVPVTKSACTAVVVVGLAEQMTLVRTQRLVRKGVLTLERASQLFSPEVLSGVEPAWFCGPCGMLVAPTEVRDNDRLRADQYTRKPVCPHCKSTRLGKRGSHVWNVTFPILHRKTGKPSSGGLSISPPIVVEGTDYTGHNLPESALTSIKLGTSKIQASDWVCKKCSWYNFRDQTKCRRCSAGRAVSTLTVMFEGAKLGDWICGNCMRLNFHKLDTCFGCYPPKKEGCSSGEVSMLRDRGIGVCGGAGMDDVDAGSAFLTRDEMDKVNLVDFKAPEEDSTTTSNTPRPLVRKPFIGARAHALVILGEDLTNELFSSFIPPPTPGVEAPFMDLDQVNLLIPRIYSTFGVCPSCGYRHHHLDVLPGSLCKECHTELTIKIYPFVEGGSTLTSASTSSDSEATPVPAVVDPPREEEGAVGKTDGDTVVTTTDTSSQPTAAPTFVAPTVNVTQFIRTRQCGVCNTINHIDRDLCRRCGTVSKGWMCTADDIADDELFEDGVATPAATTTTTTTPPRTCSHINDDSTVYCTKCGTCRKDAPPANTSRWDRTTFGSRIEAQITQSPNWLSKSKSHTPREIGAAATEASKEVPETN